MVTSQTVANMISVPAAPLMSEVPVMEACVHRAQRLGRDPTVFLVLA